ncbi:MAG: right-handed parallel beta-helix repeat-containing protein, partial [Methanosarcina sp.]|nr:right-handed parallel beta-helix repeat-containing protein [Methanosarcina sp.]
MKNLKTLMKILTLTLFCLVLSSPAALASNIVIDDDAQPAVSGLYLTSDYKDDAACIQAALDNSKSGDTITIREGDYYIKNRIYQSSKSLNIIGEGKVTLHIQTSDNEFYGIYFSGSLVTSKKLAANAKKGSSQVVLTDASQVRQNDLIKIWKTVKWCPLDYPDQMTGEIYAVKSVNGNVVTLNQPLLRDYSLSETVQTEVYRPIEMHIKNIRLEDTGATTSHHGLVMQYCKDSSVTNSRFSNSGFGAICLYSCFNVDVNNNEIYDCLKPGSGYGVNTASGSAFVNIEHNHIENCRHAITGNSAELKSLNRDVIIADNTLIGAQIAGSDVVDAHPVTINYIVTRNKIYPQLPYFFAFLDGTQYSEFTENEVYGGYGAV